MAYTSGKSPLAMATGFEFRKKLFFISNQLGAKELKDLKFLVDDDLAQMVKEKIKTPFELLCALEDSGKITEEDTSLLVQLLDAIKRKHLLNTSPGPTSVPSSLMTKGGYSRAQLKPFLVNSISDKLSLCDLRNIICFFFKRNDFTLGYHKLEKIGNPTELFELLFEQQVLNVGKLSSLWEVLSIIGRRDLCTAITKFHSESQTQPPANPSLTTPTNPQAASEETRRPNKVTLSEKAESELVFSPSHGPPRVIGVPLSNNVPSSDTEQSTMSSSGSASLDSDVSMDTKNYRRPREEQNLAQEELSQTREKQLEKIVTDQRNMIEKLRKTINFLEQPRPMADTYRMQSKPHGLAVIFVNEVFARNPCRPQLQLHKRDGAQMDLMNFCTAFTSLGYEVIVHQDKKAEEIKSLMSNIMSKDHTPYDSFVFCVSTHGEANHYIFGSDSKTVDVNELVNMSKNCPSLDGKPKMFFIQACRVEPLDKTALTPAIADGGTLPYNLQADVFIAFATTPKHAAYRSQQQGSWFVVALCSILTDPSQQTDLVGMMYQVNAIICQMEGQEQGTNRTVQQCVETSSTLRKKIMFSPQLM